MLSHNILKSFQWKLLMSPDHHRELKDIALSSYMSLELPWLRVVSFKVVRSCEVPTSSNRSIQSVGVRTILSGYGSLSPPHRVGWVFAEDGQQPPFCLCFILSLWTHFFLYFLLVIHIKESAYQEMQPVTLLPHLYFWCWRLDQDLAQARWVLDPVLNFLPFILPLKAGYWPP